MVWVAVFWFLLWNTLEFALSQAHIFAKVAVTILLIVLIIGGAVVGIYAGYNNALYFDQFIQKGTGLPINTEIPDNLLRLTTDTLAGSIASQHMSEFGSNVQIINIHIIMYQGRLVWAAMIAREGSWSQIYSAEGLVIIDASNPDAPPQIIHQRFDFAEGLTWNPIFGAWGNAQAKGYYGIDTAKVYGRVYATQDPQGNWVTVMSTYSPDWQGVRHYTGVYILDVHGNIKDWFQAGEVPKWVSQPFDENQFLEQGINDWGNFRREGGFDLWAQGFFGITPSNDRVALTEDTRYIYDPDLQEIVAIDQVHPVRTDVSGAATLAGVFKSTHEGIFYYDMSQLDLISGDTAGSAAIAKVNAPATGTKYFTAQELLYPLQVGNATRLVYFVPVYSSRETNAGTTNYRIHGLAVVDAKDQNNAIVVYSGSNLVGPSLVAAAKAAFRANQGVSTVPTTSTEIAGTVQSIYQYTANGSSNWILTMKTSENKTVTVYANANNLSRQDIFKLLATKTGDIIAIYVDVNDNLVQFQ